LLKQQKKIEVIHCLKRIQHEENGLFSRTKPNGRENQFKDTNVDFSENKEECIQKENQAILRNADLLTQTQSWSSHSISRIKGKNAGCQRFMPIILAIWEAEIRRTPI
jgi:hypothetical protein